MRLLQVNSLVAVLLLGMFLVKCGGNNSSPPPPQYPVPSLSTLSPQSAVQFGTGLTLTVNGNNFINNSVVRIDGNARATQFISATSLSITLTSGDLATLASLQITAANPAPGGGISNALSFDVTQPSPGVLSLVTLASDGSQANADSVTASFSADGRFVAFDSMATNLVPNDTNARSDVFVRDTCLGVTSACTPSTTRASVASDGTQGNDSSSEPTISPDGRFVVFTSAADNLVANDTNFASDVFIRDTCARAPAGCVPSTALVSLAFDGSQADYASGSGLVNQGGRYVAFTSGASNLVPGGSLGFFNVFVRDTCIGASSGCAPNTTKVSVATDGSEANGPGNAGAAISADGRFVVFQSSASNLVANDTNNAFDIFVRDTCVGAPAGCSPATTRASIANDGSEGNDGSFVAAISRDGRFISFTSLATNLVANDTNGKYDVYMRDTCFGVSAGCAPSTTRISLADDGSQGDGDSLESSVASDGRFVVLASVATNFVPNDSNASDDVFVRDTCIGVLSGCTPSTIRVSVAADGTQGDAHSYQGVISPDGRFVLLRSIATDLVPSDQNGVSDFFIAFN